MLNSSQDCKQSHQHLSILPSSASLNIFFPAQMILYIKVVRWNKPGLGQRPVNSATQDTGSRWFSQQMALFTPADFSSSGASLTAAPACPQLCSMISQFLRRFLPLSAIYFINSYFLHSLDFRHLPCSHFGIK